MLSVCAAIFFVNSPNPSIFSSFFLIKSCFLFSMFNLLCMTLISLYFSLIFSSSTNASASSFAFIPSYIYNVSAKRSKFSWIRISFSRRSHSRFLFLISSSLNAAFSVSNAFCTSYFYLLFSSKRVAGATLSIWRLVGTLLLAPPFDALGYFCPFICRNERV